MINFSDTNHYKYEEIAEKAGYGRVAGGDEAGRGPWAGPVCAAMVVLPKNHKIQGLDDSKKLSKKKRLALFEEIKAKAIAYGIGYASPQEIDELNILEATKLAFYRAFKGLTPEPDYVLLDHIKLPFLDDLGIGYQAFVKGESVSASVAAASILAKESRDGLMLTLADQFPEYGFEKHMGYGTKLHREMLELHGPCEVHRQSFAPIKKLLARAKSR
jgi:ribonuclease HII